MVHFKEKARYDYDDLLEIIRVLRSPEGCPWDQVQTHQSIRRGLLEEAYEAAEGIDRDDADLLREELGDVLMQAVQDGANVAEELGDVLFAAVKAARFAGVDPEDALNAACEKFIRRYGAVEQGARDRGVSVSDLTLEEMTGLWNAAK